jgi:putative hydrolase of the HAD superfamily
LIEDPAPGLMQFCAEAMAVSPSRFTRAHEALAGPFQEGHITEEEFWRRVCTQLGRPVPIRPSLWGEAFRAIYRPRPEMFGLVGKLRDCGYRTALLSNTEPPCVQYFREAGYDMFDVQVFSCEEGICKPDLRIYTRTVERLGVAGPRTVFVDDRPAFVEGAQKAGLYGIPFADLRHLRQDVAVLGIDL